MATQQEIRELAVLGQGWIRADGHVLACTMYGHLDALVGDAIHGDGARALVDRIAHLKAAGLGGRRGPYDQWCTDASEFTDSLLEHGWIKVGVDGIGARRLLEVEATSLALQDQGELVEAIRRACRAAKVNHIVVQAHAEPSAPRI